MSKVVIRCAACTRRIRDHHSYVGVEDLATGKEVCFHARPRCQGVGARHMSAMLERGRVYIMHHYHVCGDEAAGFGCAGGCFTGVEALCPN